MEREFLRYRAEPTDRNFNEVFRVAQGWLRKTAISTIRGYRNLSIDGDLDDLVSEGALAMSRAARRFVWVCPTCADPFLRRDRMRAHARDAHRIRGLSGFVSIETFCQCSSRLAIRRAAFKSLRVGEIVRDDIEVGVDDGLDARLAFDELLTWARTQLSADALDVIRSILDSDSPEPIMKPGELPPEPLPDGLADLESPLARFHVDDLREVLCGLQNG